MEPPSFLLARRLMMSHMHDSVLWKNAMSLVLNHRKRGAYDGVVKKKAGLSVITVPFGALGTRTAVCGSRPLPASLGEEIPGAFGRLNSEPPDKGAHYLDH